MIFLTEYNAFRILCDAVFFALYKKYYTGGVA